MSKHAAVQMGSYAKRGLKQMNSTGAAWSGPAGTTVTY